MKKNKLLYFVGILAIIYLISKPNKKRINVKPQMQPQQDDSMVSNYNIIPLPDLKNYKFSSVVPMQVIGATTTSPIMVATLNR